MSALSFFQPSYLWALGFLAAVLALHFFRRRVIKRMDISTLRFLPAAAVSQSRVRKLIDILLLLARLLIVAALVFIFAGLHDRNSPLVALRAPKSVVYSWADPTMSMEYAENGVPMGRRAADIVDSLTEALPPSSEHYLFDHESGRFSLADGKAKRDRAAIDGVSAGRGGASPGFAGRFGPPGLEEAIDAYLSALSSRSSKSSNPSIFIAISDFQKGTADAFDSLSPMLAGDDNTVICVSTKPPKPYNYSVSVRGGADSKGAVTAVVRAYGAALDTTFVELTAGNLRAGQRSVFCERDDSVVVTFDMPSAKSGAWGAVTLHANDPLPFDNRDYFVISEDPRRSVLIVGSVERNRVVAAAIRASGPSFWDPITVKEGNELSYEDLNSADLVIVNNFNGRSRILESFIAGAGAENGVIVTLDPEREDDFGRAFLQSGGFARTLSVNTVEKGTNPILSDTNSTLWRGFPALTSANARVYRHLTPVPGDVLVRLGNGRPLVSSIGPQNMLVVSTPIGITQTNNLCETGFFVPFIDRLGRHALAARGQAEPDRYAGYAFRNPFFGTSRAGTLYDADGKLIANWSNQPYVRVDKPGVYSLTSSSGESTHISVSSCPSESEMVFARPDLEKNGGIYYFESDQFIEQIGNLSNNIWSYRLWAILGLLLCAEVFLWKRQR